MSSLGKIKGVCSSCEKLKYEENPEILFTICGNHYLIECPHKCDNKIPLFDLCEKCTSKYGNLSNRKVQLCLSDMPFDDD